jgi:hypothetical protein
MQCPYVGGGAVERARSMIAMVNDSIVYNDSYTCLQSGIYRMAKSDSLIDDSNNKIIIQPNPASNEVNIVLKGMYEGLCNIQIQNSVGEIIFIEQMNCKDSIYKINTSKFPQGIYIVKVNVNNFDFVNSKLVIIR